MPTEGWDGDIGNHDWGGFVSAQSEPQISGCCSLEASIRADADHDLSIRIDALVSGDIHGYAKLSAPNVFTDVNTFTGVRFSQREVSADYEITHNDYEILVDASADNVVITLPDASGDGQLYRVKKTDDTENVVTIIPQDGDLIDGETSIALSNQWDACDLINAAIDYWDKASETFPALPSDIALKSSPNIFTDLNTFTGLRIATTTVYEDTLLTGLNFEVLVDATDGDVIITLPASSGSGQYYRVKKIDDSANIVTVQADGSDLIDGSTSLNFLEQYADCTIVDAAAGYWDNAQSSASTGAELFIDLLDVPSNYIGQAGKLAAVNFDEDGLEFVNPPPPSGQSRLIEGGVVVWDGTGFNYTVTSADYLINGVQYASPETNIILDPADPSDDRIDVVAVDDTGSVVVITGAPGGPPVEPQIDPASQLKLTIIYITAGSIVPVVTNEDLYHENTEYTATSNSGNINVNSTNNPHAGTKCIEGTIAAAGNYVQLVKPSGTLALSDYSTLVFYIRSKATWSNNKSISIFWMNGASNVGSPVALKNGSFGFDSSNTSSYQLIAIPTSLFNVPSITTVDRLRMAVAGGGGSIGFYIDDIILQAGIVVGSGVTKFIDLDDVPGSYTGASNRLVKVNSAETGLEFVSPASIATSVTSAEMASLVQIASAAATSANNHANTVSARVVSVSAELNSLLTSAAAALSTRIDGISGSGGSVTSQEVSVLVQIASAAATSADVHANTVSARVVSVSAELGSLVQIASAAATSAINKAVSDNASLSAVITASINTVSARVVSVSAELASLVQIASAAATSADAHANTVSGRVVSVSAELNSLLNSVESRLSTRIDTASGGGGGGSVTSQELSVIAAGLSGRIDGVSVGGGGTISKVTGSNFATSSTTLVDITGLTFAAAANKLYEVDALLLITSDSIAGMRVGAAYSAAGSTITIAVGGGAAANVFNFTVELETLNSLTSQVFGTDSTVPKAVILKGFLKTGANSGNLTLKALKVTSGQAVVYIGSRMTVFELA